MLCGLMHYTTNFEIVQCWKGPEIYSWKWDRGVIKIHLAMKTMLCKASHCVAQGWGGIGRHQYTVFDRRGPRCAHMPDLCPSAASTLLICPHSSLLFSAPSHVHRCLNSGYMSALQSAPRLNCVASLCSLNCAGQATGSKGRAGGGHSFSV